MYDVAVKILHVDDDDVDSPLINTEKEFLDEAKMMLGLDDHPHIIKIAGICSRIGTVGFVARLSLDEQRQDYWGTFSCMGCSSGERNLLLKHDLLVKISDFGLSRALGRGEDIYTASNRGKWPVKWYAPENFSFAEFTIASDVWSFGIVLWEMHSLGATPYGEMSGAEINDMLERGDRLEKPARCPSDVYKIMENCWAYRPEDRPTFERLDRYFSCERYENLPSTTLLKNRAKLAKSPRKA
ncbi:unnamed protein product [Notodromas monacha]|uniref:Protein kinase domain-containing protein n=1 Tax=Notodromas monacha TaxID=399045 RepID=A0A7R9BT64_9CRUS|nr:unnamed protein product [Notodromas monacha]CAG0920209.1 unnamed protein product [Notodromas monacha]